ncbi:MULTISPECIES: HNH endonuclease [Burkholderia cepacia complex]|uniref:HNH endonuclease n=1 Tax=Burkholderia cepacia complex TaxID=87882 RepID=UPI00158F365C|nr:MULTISPECIES: HNH endonuclease signature motif containing protein [Burkholderia cepacia complex]MBR8374068.1 HNH endonuclease [Burkholderia cenocepacia]MBR8443038.1 HNH endonuclease [Burkholderia cenocepacia]UVE67734.1 HNH endonuclease [Burkholderia pyrrocinia]
MHAIAKPLYEPNYAFNACVNDTANADLQLRLRAIAPDMIEAGQYYDRLATEGRLHQMARADQPDADLALGLVTKGELRNLYEAQMIPRHKTAREIYDNIRAAAPDGKCPTCGFGHVHTVDHFLPKSAFPWFSVLPENLVPACRDCNTGKMAAAANDAQSFHPYYDSVTLMQDEWIVAEVVRTKPIRADYFVRVPPHWNELQALRAATHFRDYKIGQRFAVEAGSELSSLVHYFSNPPMTPNEIKDVLSRKLRAERQRRCNSWKIALFQALHDCEWFCALDFEGLNA